MPTLTVNGQARDLRSAPSTPLLWVLRDELGLTGAKYGCGTGLCGACTVHLDGKAVRACQVTLAQAAEQTVLTVEGLAASDPSIFEAWLAEDVSQCGFCQPGQIMSAAALLARTPAPTDGDVASALRGNLCRCGSYQRALAAVHRAARQKGAPSP